MRVVGLAGLGPMAMLGGCAADRDQSPAGPSDEATGPSAAGHSGYVLDVDVRGHRVALRPPTQTAGPNGPSFSILEGEAIGLQVSNYSVSEVGAFTPGKLRVRFDLSITNHLSGVSLEPPTLGATGEQAPALMVFPQLQRADLTTGAISISQDGAVIVDRSSRTVVSPSVDWDGDGTLERWQGFDFSGDSGCVAPAPGCSRWEAMAPLAPGVTSPTQTVGFDLDPTVSGFRAWILLAADLQGGVDSVPAPDPPPVLSTWSGIPFGEFHRPAEDLGDVQTGALRAVSPASVLAVLDSAKQRHARVVISMPGNRRQYTNPDSTFNLTLWKQRVDEFRGINLQPYVDDGTLVANYLVDEPNWAGGWGGRTISYATLEEMARYSKTIWPSLPTVVRVVPQWLRGAPFSWLYLDAAWAQYEGPQRDGNIASFRTAAVSAAQALHLGLIFGLNTLNGGDGSSGIEGTYPDAAEVNRWQMSAAEVRAYGAVLAQDPYACALINWMYRSDFDDRDDVRAALSYVSLAASSRPSAPCRRH